MCRVSKDSRLSAGDEGHRGKAPLNIVSFPTGYSFYQGNEGSFLWGPVTPRGGTDAVSLVVSFSRHTDPTRPAAPDPLRRSASEGSHW